VRQSVERSKSLFVLVSGILLMILSVYLTWGIKGDWVEYEQKDELFPRFISNSFSPKGEASYWSGNSPAPGISKE